MASLRVLYDATGTYSFTFDNMGRLIGTTTNYAFLTGRHLTAGYGELVENKERRLKKKTARAALLGG